jgi:hypothetical protein
MTRASGAASIIHASPFKVVMYTHPLNVSSESSLKVNSPINFFDSQHTWAHLKITSINAQTIGLLSIKL